VLTKLLTSCESVGLNEVELKMFAEDAEIKVSSEVDRLKQFAEKIPSPILLFHTFGHYIALNRSNKQYAFENGFKTAEQVVLKDRRVPNSVEI